MVFSGPSNWLSNQRITCITGDSVTTLEGVGDSATSGSPPPPVSSSAWAPAVLFRPDLIRLATWARLERRPTGHLVADDDRLGAVKLAAITTAERSGRILQADPFDIRALVIAMSMTLVTLRQRQRRPRRRARGGSPPPPRPTPAHCRTGHRRGRPDAPHTERVVDSNVRSADRGPRTVWWIRSVIQ